MDDQPPKIKNGLSQAYGHHGPDSVGKFYDGWADGYEAEVAEHGYVTPERCAKALAAAVKDPSQPIMDLGCGTGLSGLALKAQGFTTIDGFDLSPGMLERARGKDIYRALDICDMSQPLKIPAGTYANAAAIGCITPDYMPVTILDEIFGVLPEGGCLSFSVNDYAAKAQNGALPRYIYEMCDCWTAEMVSKSYGAHLPGNNMGCTVYVLRKR